MVRGARFGVLRLRPSDVLVVMTDHVLSMQQMQHMADNLRRSGIANQAVFLSKGCHLGILRKGARP
jgi:hypothetical protein